jgi:hypothetical protein
LRRNTIIAVCAAFTYSFAQHPDAGTVAFPSLNMGYDARAVSMSGAAAAMPNDIYGVLANPAAIGFVNRYQVMGGYRQMMMDVWGGPLGIAKSYKFGVFAASVTALSSGAFDVVDENDDETGARAQSSYTSGGVSFAKIVYDGLSVGGTVKGVYHYIGAGLERYSADGFAVDFGVQYRLMNGRLIYGAVLRNFGVMRSSYLDKFNEYPFPYGVEVGISHVPQHMSSLRLALDVNKINGDYLNFEPALEYAILSKTLFLRGGYAFSYMDFEKTLEKFKGERDENYRKSSANTLSLGLGIATSMDNVDVKLDAAIQFYTDVPEPSLIISLLFAF